MSDNTILCRLCVGSADLIEIYSEHGVRLRISEILGEHFWFKVSLFSIAPKNPRFNDN